MEVPADSVAFSFLGGTMVIYRNRSRKNTYGPDGAFVAGGTLHYREGGTETFTGKALRGKAALHVRQGKVERIETVLEAVNT